MTSPSVETVPVPSVGFRTLRWALAFVGAIVVLGVYSRLSLWNVERFESGARAHALWTNWDTRLPTLPWMIWPYMLYYVLVFSPVALARRWVQIAELAVAYFSVTAVAWALYVMWPVRMVYPALGCGGLSCRILVDLYQADQGVNVMPSQHAAHAILAAMFCYSYRSRFAPLVLAGALLVSAAAVLTKQHYLVDVPAGLLLGVAGWWLVRTVFQPLREGGAVPWRQAPAGAAQGG
jgi:membrane-associated phospholipid phosphatase